VQCRPRAVFVTGETGTGKTVLVDDLLRAAEAIEVRAETGEDSMEGAGPGAEGEGREGAGAGAAAASRVRAPKLPLSLTPGHSVPVTFSARTSSASAQATIEGRLVRRRKGLLTPAPGRRAIVFVDDVNMPNPEE